MVLLIRKAGNRTPSISALCLNKAVYKGYQIKVCSLAMTAATTAMPVLLCPAKNEKRTRGYNPGYDPWTSTISRRQVQAAALRNRREHAFPPKHLDRQCPDILLSANACSLYSLLAQPGNAALIPSYALPRLSWGTANLAPKCPAW